LLLGLLADPAKQTTVNATLMQAGTVSNAIPDHASVTADVRIQEPGEFDRIERDLAKQISHVQIEGTTVTATLDRGFPPFPHLASTDELAERAKKLYAEIDRPLAAAATGGAGDIGLVAETGTPALDGLGFVGGGAHGVDDYVVISSITPRTYLLARMIMDLGQDPPKR
jgi:glutamate carboxypeptidase